MAMNMPTELREILQRSLDTAKDLQSHINDFNGPLPTADDTLLNTLIQAHTAHLLNHSTIIRHITSAFSGSDHDGALKAVTAAGEQMIKDARMLQEYVVVSSNRRLQADVANMTDTLKGLHVTKTRGKNRPVASAPPVRSYRAPTVEPSDDERAKKQEIPPQPEGRKSKAHWSSKKNATEKLSTEEADTLRISPKRSLEEGDELPTQAMVKRTKLSPAPPKRKSDVSMVDATSDADEESPPTPQVKRQKRDPPAEEANVQVEYEDITAEVDKRMLQREERKEREKKMEMGIVDKRKRMSNDSFQVEIGDELVNGDVEKPDRKKKKRRHEGS